MSDLIVVVFDDAEEAGKVRASLKSVEHEGRLSLDDTTIFPQQMLVDYVRVYQSAQVVEE